MKQERQKLEDNLNLILQDYSNDKKVIEAVTIGLGVKGIPIGKVSGLFSGSIDLSYISEIELCLFTKYFYDQIHEFKINPETYFNEVELSVAEQYRYNEKEKTRVMLLHNVDQVEEDLYLCSRETYQNVEKFFSNGLWTYNPNTQRQPLKRKIGDRIIEVINIDKGKIKEIKTEMIKGTFNTNAIMLNVRRITGSENIHYNAKNRTLLVEIDETTFIDLIDGMHRVGGMLKAIEEKPEINRVTSIYIHHKTEERALAVIRQESKSTPISDEWIELKNTANVNMEVAKGINTRQRKNEMFNKIGLDNLELRRENKFVTFETLSKTVEYVYDLKEEPFIKAEEVEDHLIDLFNIVIGINHSMFNEFLTSTRESFHIADNNMFIGYVVLGEELKKKYEYEWKSEFKKILKTIDFSKSNPVWKKIGIENNLNLSTIKKIAEYFRSIVNQEGVA